jgi:hypothetical protein
MKGPMTDLTFADRGATWLIHSNTAAGAEWIKKYIPANAQTFLKAIVIDHRYASRHRQARSRRRPES